MITLIPAIDIIDGKCVRLTKGDYGSKTVYSGSPVDIAKMFEQAGMKRLHVVDLDGAKSRHVVNVDVLRSITSQTGLEVDFGGGIKTDDDIMKAFDNGAAMVTVGSVAVTDSDMFARWLERFGPERIILGADVRDGKICINGWREDTAEDIIAFLSYYVGKGVRHVLCTDISKDGMLAGPSFDLYGRILKAFPDIDLIASGGVSSVGDIRRLAREGVPSVVFGKAVYEGKIDVSTLVGELSGGM